MQVNTTKGNMHTAFYSGLLQDFGEHGREYITSEVALRLLSTLTDPAALAGMLGGSGPRLERLQAILARTVLKVNPGGEGGGSVGGP
jgi:hypothetical protein